jgi:hypothetical protein
LQGILKHEKRLPSMGEVTVRSNATMMDFGIVIAYSPGDKEIMGGSAMIMVPINMPDFPDFPDFPDDGFPGFNFSKNPN